MAPMAAWVNALPEDIAGATWDGALTPTLTFYKSATRHMDFSFYANFPLFY